jgi:aminoglycoside phosphotransferase (APT) family kinase protein
MGDAAQGSEVAGIDVARVSAWLVANGTGIEPPLVFEALPGGHSNFTYRVSDARGRSFVLRRPPMGELLPSAHDMGREYRLISALWPTPVPVPEPIAHCTDPAVTGAPFYAMGFVEGKGLYCAGDVEGYLDGGARARTGPSFIDTLAALHALDPDAVGLGDLGKRDSYVGRQLNRWYQSWNASKNRELPDVDRLQAWLVARLPEQTTVSVVHGDYGLHNCRVAAAGHIAAVLDWEISTLGDPLADLAYCINGWAEAGDVTSRVDPPTILAGFASREALVDRYADASGADLSQLPYYRAFNHWKTVCIIQGVYARYLAGQKEAQDPQELAEWPERIERTLGLAVDAARELGF